jgi:hypothetical protein
MFPLISDPQVAKIPPFTDIAIAVTALFAQSISIIFKATL